ncbi:sec-independent protein translocase protein TatA [Allocatelliglobosispora scoriae]|uniref:Sec-independent protein translocase protein TatA n=1 Tax=Allocatelliglobosispora scoriae TaxID=643052 RepID=A0A841C281_9ACTN|nr:Sec-independent protein translocase subunit TatA [Allocatelliglobosispora scoriae]MBB5873868.1 sec-independent protein translocase protein TatA [Allocatelliglobosispora scoriae]
MGALKPWHIILVVVVLVLLFGAKRLPDAARSLGRSMRIMKAETKGLMEDGKEADKGDLAGKAEANAARTPLSGEVQAPAAPVADPVQRVNER